MLETISPVQYATALTLELLKDLLNDKIKALRIPNFCSKEIAEHALKNLEKNALVEYRNAAGVGKYQNLGMAYFEVESEETQAHYYEQRLSAMEELRAVFSPYLSPVDQMRLQLDEKWPKGASLLNLGKGPMFLGLVRALSKEVLPHEDKLDRDDPQLQSKMPHYLSQLSFNCYLKVPKLGGALQLWDLSLEDAQYRALSFPNYGIERSKLPPPALELVPSVGELILFNPRNLHAVSTCHEEELRVSASGFIAYQGDNYPLHFWS